MESLERIKAYTQIVCKQIRWKKAQGPITCEIENHIMEQREAYIVEGASEIEATEMAVQQMGDPVLVGMQLDRTHRPKTQWGMLLLTMSMVMIGVLVRMLLMPDSIEGTLSGTEWVSIAVGFTFMMIAYFSDFSLIGKHPKIVCGAIVGIAVLTFYTFPRINSSNYFLSYDVASITGLFPLAFTAILYKSKGKGYLGILQCGLLFWVMSYITLRMPALKDVLILSLTSSITLFIAVHRNWFKGNKLVAYIISFFMVSWPLVLIGIMCFHKIVQRMNMVLGSSYLASNAKSLIQNSRWLGHGQILSSELTEGFQLPNIETDYMLTYLIYNYGWLFSIGIVGLILFFIINGFRHVLRQKSSLGLFVSLPIMTAYTIQVFGYILWNLGFQGATAFYLPLIAKGNVLLIVNLALVGILLSVFRTGDLVKDKFVKKESKIRRVYFDGGKLVFDFGKNY